MKKFVINLVAFIIVALIGNISFASDVIELIDFKENTVSVSVPVERIVFYYLWCFRTYLCPWRR